MPQAKKPRAAKADGATPQRKTTRDYVVVKVDEGTLTIVDPQRSAKNHEDAIERVMANMEPTERNGVYGAFVSSSYREQEFETAQTWATTSKPRQPAFVAHGSGASPAQATPTAAL